mgnify:CR=1 FL=1
MVIPKETLIIEFEILSCINRFFGVQKPCAPNVLKGLLQICQTACKVSLPTLKLLADTDGTTLDEFLADSLAHEKTVHKNDIASELGGCSPVELRYFAQMIKNEKQNLRSNFSTQQNKD